MDIKVKRIRVGFTMIGGKNWKGGYNYLLNLLEVIDRFCGNIEPVLFLGTDENDDDVRPFRSIKRLIIVTNPLFNMAWRYPSLAISVVFGVDGRIKKIFNENKIDVLFESARFFGSRIDIPTIAWIPDFQHRALPQMFSRASWIKRELGFRLQIKNKRTIMVSSNDSKKSCELFYPNAVGRVCTVRFALNLRDRPNQAVVKQILKLYQIPEKYFFLPNQFWEHKNHLAVVEALSLLKQQGFEVIVVSTGQYEDLKRGGIYERIKSKIKDEKLEKNFRFLGLVPFEHVSTLLAGSVALLNPSLFEGWSTTVEEAKRWRVPMILSDLDVHFEQAAGLAVFFKKYSAHDLAEKMISVWSGDFSQSLSQELMTEPQLDSLERFYTEFSMLVDNVLTIDIEGNANEI